MIYVTVIEVCSPHLCASFGTFCVQIGQLFAAQRVFKHSEKIRNQRYFPSMTAICQFSHILQRFTVPQIIDQSVRKRCQKEAQWCGLQNTLTVSSKIFWCTWTVDCQKLVHYIHMLCTGCVILNDIVHQTNFFMT